VRIHRKDLAVTDHATALPERKRADLFVRDAHLGSIDGNAGTDTTNCLPVERENGLEQRHAAREIASLFEPSGERLRRIGNGERGDGQMVAPGSRSGRLRRRSRRSAGVIAGSMVVPMAATAIATVASTDTACHRITRLRRSQA
jgi:hypothetical protein